MGRPLQSHSLLSAQALDHIERAVASAEAKTSCEFVVVLAPASSRYEGRAVRLGAGLALATYFILYWILRFMGGMPDALWLLAEACASGALGAWAFSRFLPLGRLLVSRKLRSATVASAAGATFFEQKVSHTKERNAALIFVSVLEGEARLIADLGLLHKVPEAKLNEISAHLNTAGSGDGVALIEAALAQLGELCAKEFPRAENDHNELPDKPIIRLP